MKVFFQKSLRVAGRLIWLGGEILLALLDFLMNVVLQRGIPLPRARALWLQQTCRRALRILDLDVKTHGPIPTKGLLVCNYLSYVDILVISAITPSVFISRSEVRRWPIFGWFGRLAGALFVQPGRRSDVARLNREVAQVLDGGGLVVLFTENSNLDEPQVPQFKSSLLEPVTRLNQPLSAAFISYWLDESDTAEDVSYSGDGALMPHLIKLFAKSRARAFVSFTRLPRSRSGRKQLAQQLHSEVLRLKESLPEQSVT